MVKLKIEYVPIGDLKTYPNNAKIHTAEQIEQIKESIKEFGFNDPLAVWKDNEIIEGHGRLIAAKELGMKELPVIRLDGLSDEQRRAYILVHNKLTMNTDFDVDIVSLEIEEIEGIDMSQFGFNEISYLDDLLEEDIAIPNKDSEEFAITFNFPIEKKEQITEFIREKGKDGVVKLIIKESEDYA